MGKKTGSDPLQRLWDKIRGPVPCGSSEMPKLQIIQHSPNPRLKQRLLKVGLLSYAF